MATYAGSFCPDYVLDGLVARLKGNLKGDIMFNDHLFNEVAKDHITQRMKEAETYSLHKRLGYGDHESARWIFVLVILTAVAVVLLLG